MSVQPLPFTALSPQFFLPVVGKEFGDIVTDVTETLYDNAGILHLTIQSSLLLDLGIGQEFTNAIKKR
jgi:hypothetical protein